MNEWRNERESLREGQTGKQTSRRPDWCVSDARAPKPQQQQQQQQQYQLKWQPPRQLARGGQHTTDDEHWSTGG